ncbi:MAG: LapA family protein [Planctomycetota bacterium JB042]
MGRIKAWGVVAAAVILVVVVLQNTETVATRLLFVTVEMPRAALLGVTLLVGLALGVVWGSRLGARSRPPEAP